MRCWVRRAYLLLSGMSVPTQRAFVMVGVVLVAIMLDRASLSMRLIAWAALLVLAIAPESMLGPSFQMSFAATTALIATYEAARGLFARMAARGGLVLRPVVYAAGVTLTSLVAGIATGPFAVYHFNRIADYGLLANLGAVPITGFWIMPWGLVALILMPFGLEGIALAPMGWGIDAVVWIRARGRGAAGRGQPRSGDAGSGLARDLGRRIVALPLAQPLALLRDRGDQRWDRARRP